MIALQLDGVQLQDMAMTALWAFPVASGLASHLVFHRFRPREAMRAVVEALVAPTVLSFVLVPTVEGSAYKTVFSIYTLYFFTLFTSIILYRISPFHPLAQFPGPMLSKITKFASVWAQCTGNQHLINHSLHRKYGPFIRTGPNELSIVEEDAVTGVLGAGGLSKGEYYSVRRDPNAPANVICLVGEAHAHRRRLWNRGMSTESLTEYEGIITRRATLLIDQLEARTSKTVDMVAWLSYFTFDFMGDMAFGGGFELLKAGGDPDGHLSGMDRFATTLAIVSHIPWIARVLSYIPHYQRDVSNFRKFAVDTATHRVKAGSMTKDLWYHLNDEAGHEKVKPPVSNVVADGALAIVAGADTTSFALAALIYELLRHPDVYAKLQEEIDSTFPLGADALDTSKHSDMPYLNACISEALRLHPPVPTNGPRQTGIDGRLIAGRYIPPHTQVYVPPYSYHRDPRYFSSPDEFLPNRWLDVKKEPVTFIPFSFGPANCVGRNLAKREMMMVMSLLLQRIKFSFTDGFDAASWPDSLHDYFVSTRGPLLTRIQRRVQ